MTNTAKVAAGHQNRFQGEFGEGLVCTLASAGGLSSSRPNLDVGFDLYLESPDGEALRLQIKTTTSTPKVVDGALRYTIDVETYDRLRKPMTVPSYLVVVEVRKHRHEWVAPMDWGFVLRRRAHYVSLLGADATANASTVTVSLPMGNIVTPNSLVALLKGGA